MVHHPELNTGFATRHELEEIHDMLEEILLYLAELRDLLEVLVESQA